MDRRPSISTTKPTQDRAKVLARHPGHAGLGKDLSAIKDKTSGLYNRTYFENLITKEAFKAHRYHRPISLFLFTLDHFGKIKSGFGQCKWDRLLKGLGAAIRRNIREADSAICYGEGAFAVVMPETDLEGALLMAERLRKQVEQLQIAVDIGSAFGVTISGGIATWARQFGTNSKSDLITAASQALHQAKQQGPNKIVSFRAPQ